LVEDEFIAILLPGYFGRGGIGRVRISDKLNHRGLTLPVRP
jgi:hypothetical protein